MVGGEHGKSHSEEVAQNYAPGRHGRLPDGVVKASGALLGVAFAMLAARHKRI